MATDETQVSGEDDDNCIEEDSTILSIVLVYHQSFKGITLLLFLLFYLITPSVPAISLCLVWARRLRNMYKVVEKRKKSG